MLLEPSYEKNPMNLLAHPIFNPNQMWDLVAHWEHLPPGAAVEKGWYRGHQRKEKLAGEVRRKGPGQKGPGIRTNRFRLNSCLCTEHTWALPVLSVPVIFKQFLCTLTCPSAQEVWQICLVNAGEPTTQPQLRCGPWLQGAYHLVAQVCRTLTNRL